MKIGIIGSGQVGDRSHAMSRVSGPRPDRVSRNSASTHPDVLTTIPTKVLVSNPIVRRRRFEALLDGCVHSLRWEASERDTKMATITTKDGAETCHSAAVARGRRLPALSINAARQSVGSILRR